jgi:acyl CoA:acetate/3-ketoacid CoA transferase alpha subunit
MKNAELQAQLEREGIFQQGLMAGAQGLGGSHMITGIDNALAGLYG